MQASFLSAGRPDSFNEDLIYYVTDEQFGYVAGVTGQMVREEPAACFYMGAFFAESLILAVVGGALGLAEVAAADDDGFGAVLDRGPPRLVGLVPPHGGLEAGGERERLRGRQLEELAQALRGEVATLRGHDEQLTRDLPGELARIQHFLGVPHEPVSPGTEKRPRRTLAAQIDNYAELKEQFRATPWADYFTE